MNHHLSKIREIVFFFPFIDQFDDDWTKFVRETKEKVFNEFQHGRLSVWQITIFFYMSNSQHVSRNQRKKNHDCRLRGSKVMGHFTNMWITGPTIGDLNSTFWSPWGQSVTHLQNLVKLHHSVAEICPHILFGNITVKFIFMLWTNQSIISKIWSRTFVGLLMPSSKCHGYSIKFMVG